MGFDLLSKAAQDFEVICQVIANEEDLDEGLLRTFHSADAHLSTQIDRRKAFLRELEAKKTQALNYIEEIKTYIKRCDRISERLIKLTIKVIEENPDHPWRDSLGKKLSVCPSQPKLVISDEVSIDPVYTYEVTEIKIDKEAVKKDLLAGYEFGWAKLEYNTHLRGL